MRNFRLVVCLLVLPLLAAPIALEAAPAKTADLERLLDRKGVSGSDAGEIVRSFRGAVNLGLNAKRLEALVGSALDNGLEPDAIARALHLIGNAALNGLPASSIINKFSEGLAKKADQEEIVEAMENRAMALQKARQILSVVIYDDKPLGELETLLISVAGALERGVDEGDLEDILKDAESFDLRSIILEVEKLD